MDGAGCGAVCACAAVAAKASAKAAPAVTVFLLIIGFPFCPLLGRNEIQESRYICDRCIKFRTYIEASVM